MNFRKLRDETLKSWEIEHDEDDVNRVTTSFRLTLPERELLSKIQERYDIPTASRVFRALLYAGAYRLAQDDPGPFEEFSDMIQRLTE